MPPWLALALGLIAAAALALTFRYEGVEQQVLRDAPEPDMLHLAYMHAWLAAHPAEHGLRLRLARDLTRIGRYDAARTELALIEPLANALRPALAERVALQSIDTDLAALYALDPAHPQRPAALALLHERLERITLHDFSPLAEVRLAEQSAAVGARQPAAHWYGRALERNLAHAPDWWAQGGRSLAALREPTLAARLYLRARAGSRTLEAEREYFIAALQALRSDHRLDAALALAEAELGRLLADTATLEYLTRLALAAGRPDLAQHYATLMLKLSLLRDALAAGRAAALPARWHALARRIDARLAPSLTRVQAQAEDERQPRLPFDDERYRLSFEVFLANANLRDALAVARAAVGQAPNNVPWRRRLAQVADFSGAAPLALEQWHAIARLTGDEAAWQEVEKRAPAVFDYTRWLAALERKLARNPNDLATLLRMAELNELLGEPQRAIELLQAHARGTQRAEVLRELAHLAGRAGRSALQRETLQLLNRETGPTAELATAIAWLELARDDRMAAFAALRSAESVARPDAVEYWEAYAQLAQAAGDRAAALRALLLLLLDAGRAGLGALLDAAHLLEPESPRRAAELILRAHRRAPSVLLANRLLALYDRAGERDAALAFVGELDAAQRAEYEGDAGFLRQRALLWLARDLPARAVADVRSALRLAPGSTDLTALLIWSLVAAHDAHALRAQLADVAPQAATSAELWGPVGAAWLLLNEPARALPWLQRQVRAQPRDYLWWLNLADATELAGDAERAWRLRHHAWRELRAQAPVAPEAQRELRTRLASLAITFEPGDAARARLRALLADRVDPLAREAVLAIHLGTEQSDLARAWLLARYTNALTRPAWADLSVALAFDDRARIEELLDSVPDWLPLYDRVEAAQRAGRSALAQSFAFEGLAAQPDNEPLHARLAVNALPRSDYLGTSALRFAQRPLRETAFGIDVLQALTPRLQIGIEQRLTTRASTDRTTLAGELPAERATSLSLHALAAHNGRIRLQAERRDGLRAGTGVTLEAQFDPAGEVRLTATAAQRVVAADNVYLRAAGTRDAIALAAHVRLSAREYLAAEATAQRYAAGGERVGAGQTLRLEAGHRLRLAYPDLLLRASAAGVRARAEPGGNAWLISLLPPERRLAASNADFVPADTTRIALTAAVGESARAAPQRAWRPFGALTLAARSARGGGLLAARSGASYEWSLGLTGSVLGTDQLTLTADGGSSTGANANPYYQLALRYRWLH